jgi:hypothetical protein
MKRLAITVVLAVLAAVPFALVWRDQGLGIVFHTFAVSALIFAFFALSALLAGLPPVPMMKRMLVRMTGLLAFGLAGALPVGVVATFVLGDTTLRNGPMVVAGVASAAHFLDEIIDAERALHQDEARR